jgi:hypothetical protein
MLSLEQTASSVAKKEVMNKRVIMRLELELSSKKGLDDFCDRTGMTKVAALSRLIDWFCNQPDNVQAIIQGLIPTFIIADVAEIILKRLIDSKEIQEAPKQSRGQTIGVRPAGKKRARAKVQPESRFV